MPLLCYALLLPRPFHSATCQNAGKEIQLGSQLVIMACPVAVAPQSQQWVIPYSPKCQTFPSLSSCSPALSIHYLLHHPPTVLATMTAPPQKTPCLPTLHDCQTSRRARHAARRTRAASTSPSTTSSTRSTLEAASSLDPALQGDRAPVSGFRGQEIVPP